MYLTIAISVLAGLGVLIAWSIVLTSILQKKFKPLIGAWAAGVLLAAVSPLAVPVMQYQDRTQNQAVLNRAVVEFNSLFADRKPEEKPVLTSVVRAKDGFAYVFTVNGKPEAVFKAILKDENGEDKVVWLPVPLSTPTPQENATP